MDTSEQYIKMRMGAMPDLGYGTPPFNPVGGSHILDDTDGRKTYVDFSGNWYIYFKKSGEWCQLERQDQLQEMVPNEYMVDWTPSLFPLHLAKVLADFVDEMHDGWDDMSWQPSSMEQLWLAFVMKEKFDKTWDGDKWTN